MRVLAAAAVALVGLLAPIGASASTTPIIARDDFEDVLLDEINALRARHGLIAVQPSRPLQAAANRHSAVMAIHGFFGHESEYGEPFWLRVRAWYEQRGDRYWSVGQNLLWAPHEVTPKVSLSMWLQSPSHRIVLLRPRWREIGLSAIRATTAPGFFGGRDVTIVTANFGVRH